jgi:hypothetical protein
MSTKAALKILQKTHDNLPENTFHSTDYDKIRDTFTPHASELLDAFEQWDISLDMVDDSNRSFASKQPYLYIILAIAELTPEELPEWFMPYVLRLCMLERLKFVYQVKRLIARLPEETIIAHILTNEVRGKWSKNLCLTLLDLIKDEREVSRILDLVVLDIHTALSYVDDSGFRHTHSAGLGEDGVQRLAHAGPRVRELLEAKMAPDLHADVALTIVMLGRHGYAPDSAPTYVAALAHKSKEVQQLAISSLGYLGVRARPALEEGAKSKKKSVKEFCAHLLSLLPAHDPDDDPFLALDDLAQRQLITQLTNLHTLRKQDRDLFSKYKAPKSWKQFFEEEAAANPRLYLSALSWNYLARRFSTYMYVVMLQDEAFADHELEGWIMFMRAYVQTSIKDNYSIKMEAKLIDKLPAKHRAEVLAAVLPTGYGTMMVKLLPVYLSSHPIVDSNIYMRALTYPNKPVRQSAIAHAGKIAFDDISPILAELDASRKGSRLVAAEALFKMPLKLIAPHLNMLQAHLDKEKDVGVQGALNAVVARITSA